MQDSKGNEEGIGVARFIRLEEDSEVAEPAITVVDDFQGKGLGTLLLHRLAAAALEREINRFRFEILADNVRMKNMLDEVSQELWFAQPDHGVIEIEFEIPQTVAETAGFDRNTSLCNA